MTDRYIRFIHLLPMVFLALAIILPRALFSEEAIDSNPPVDSSFISYNVYPSPIGFFLTSDRSEEIWEYEIADNGAIEFKKAITIPERLGLRYAEHPLLYTDDDDIVYSFSEYILRAFSLSREILGLDVYFPYQTRLDSYLGTHVFLDENRDREIVYISNVVNNMPRLKSFFLFTGSSPWMARVVGDDVIVVTWDIEENGPELKLRPARVFNLDPENTRKTLIYEFSDDRPNMGQTEWLVGDDGVVVIYDNYHVHIVSAEGELFHKFPIGYSEEPIATTFPELHDIDDIVFATGKRAGPKLWHLKRVNSDTWEPVSYPIPKMPRTVIYTKGIYVGVDGLENFYIYEIGGGSLLTTEYKILEGGMIEGMSEA